MTQATTRIPETMAAPAGQTRIPSGTWRVLSKPEGGDKLPKGLDAAYDAAVGRLVPLAPRRILALRRAAQILKLDKVYLQMSDARLREAAIDIRAVFRLDRQTREQTNHAFAIVREVAFRKLAMKPYREQVAAAIAMDAGCVAELATGEGKTLSATMPATIAGWRGRGCHVITVNDYLAQRDAHEMGPVYRFCGLTCAHIDGDMEPPQRREAYLADVTYLTNKEVAADFLRDRLALGQTRGLPSALLSKITDGAMRGPDRVVMRGLEFAIVDEADSVLIDEAVTPLIISGDSPNAEQVDAFKHAAEAANRLEPGKDFIVDHKYREVRLTSTGQNHLEDLTMHLGGVWAGARRREELVTQALTARELFLLGKQYVVQEDKVVIVDEFTGRLMPDRTWRDGLHQAVEAKESVEVNPPKDTFARISFQRFFRLYKKLSGMTGTGWEARHEMWQIYHMPVVLIPTHKKRIRKQYRDRIFGTAEAKWKAIVQEIKKVHGAGRPILIGTRSVRASEHLSELLKAAGLEHTVLNAVRHKEEAQIVSGAGQPGRITVATNMAGRGTDIKLGPGVPEAGGLHVIATERHESGRVDRQLFGRAGRQGDPGSAIAFLSLEDELIQRYTYPWVRPVVNRFKMNREVTSATKRRWFKTAQGRAQRMALTQRKGVLRSDDWLDEFLGFAGRE